MKGKETTDGLGWASRDIDQLLKVREVPKRSVERTVLARSSGPVWVYGTKELVGAGRQD